METIPSISIEIDLNDEVISKLVRELEGFAKELKNPSNLNERRAKNFVAFTKRRTKSGGLGLKPLSDITEALAGKHNPEWLTGFLLSQIKIRKDAKVDTVYAGYFADDPTKAPNSRLRVFEIAKLQHTGYKIPLMKDGKPTGVMAYLIAKGVLKGRRNRSSGKGKQYLIVPPRPFLFNSRALYQASGEDKKLVEKYFNNLLKKVSQ